MLRKAASQVGGIPPGPNGTEPKCWSPEFLLWADAGNTPMGTMVRWLMTEAQRRGINMLDPNLKPGFDNLKVMGNEKLGDCVECALAGAFAGNRFSQQMIIP